MTIEELENKTRARFKKSSTKTAQTSKGTSETKSNLRTALAELKADEEAKMLAANNPAYAYAKANGTSTASPTTVVKGKAKTEDRKPGQINALGAGDYGASKKTKLDSTLNAAAYNAAGSVANLFGLLDELDARTKARDEADSARLKAGRDASAKGEDINTRTGGLKKQSEDSVKLFEKRYSELKGAGQKKFDTADELMQRATEEQNVAKEGLGKLGQGAVDFGIAATQFAGDALLNTLLPGAGLAAMGVRAAGGGAYEARQEGLDLDKQLTTGMKSAAIEVLTEKLFGAGSKIAYGKGLIKNQDAVNGIVNRLAKTDKGRTALKVIAAANEEGLEEVLSDILNPIADYALDLRGEDGEVLDELSFEQMAEDYIIGALLGGMGSGGNVISGQYKAENAQQRKTEEYQSALVEAAERAGEDVQKYRDVIDNSGKRGKRTLTDKETAELENIVYSPYVELRLDALGGKSSAETAKAIIKTARGEKFTKAEQKAFDENPYSRRVVNEMTEADTSNTWYTAMMNNVVYPEQRESFTPDTSEAQQVLDRSTQTKDAAAAAVFPNRAAQQRTASEMIAANQQTNAAQNIIEEGLSQPEGSAAQTYASRLREKALEGETITEEETAELNRLLTAPLELEDVESISKPRGEALDLVSEEEYDKAQKLKQEHAQAMKDGLISERKIYDAIRDGENTEDIIRENARKQLEKEVKVLPTETLNAMADYVAAGGKLATAIETAKNISEEAKNERREQSTDNGVGRKPGMDTGEQTGSVQESTGRAEENERTERSGEEAGRKNTPKVKRVSSREIGITNGTNAKTLTIDNNPNATAQRIMAAFEKAANGFVAVKGNIETKQGTVQGVTTADGKVIFRTDHRMYGQTEILLHECGHLYIRGDSDMKKALKEACLESISEKQLNELALKYGALWQGVMSEDITDEEFFDYALEEIYCDALAGIDRINARGASRLTEAVRGAFEEETGIDVDALLSGTETGETAVTTEKSKAEDLPTRNNGPPSEGEKYSKGGYWKPNISQKEWALLNSVLDTELRTSNNYIDKETKWLYKEGNGTKVFAIYGIGDGTEATVLDAVGGEEAVSALTNIIAVENIDYETGKGYIYSYRWTGLLWGQQVKYGSNSNEIIGRTANSRDDRLHAGTSESNRGRAAEKSARDSGAVGKEKFSMDEPIEEKKNLIALHNLNETKLLKTLKLGGFAMPSIAITKSDIPHTNFGDITVVFGKETIDPKLDRRNTVYSADAWTPIFPRVEYEAAPEVEAKIRDKYYKLAGKHGYELLKPMYSSANYVEDVLNNYGGEKGVIEHFADDTGMMQVFLADTTGKIVENIKTEHVTKLSDNQIEEYDALIAALGKDVINEMQPKAGQSPMTARRAWLEKHGDELKAAYRQYLIKSGLSEEAADDVMKDMKVGSLLPELVAARNYMKNGAETRREEVDTAATKEAIKNAVDMKEYKAWLEELYKGVEKSSGVYNQKDYYTANGNRRSFKQTHFPATLDGIVKAMAAQGDGNSRNVMGFHGVKSLRAGTAERFKSIEDMHKRESRLKQLTQEEADKITEALDERLSEVMHRIYDASPHGAYSNELIELDAIGEILVEAGELKSINVDSIKKLFRKYNHDLNNALAKDVTELLYDIGQMPVNIFEAKPERAVGFDEVRAVIIPDTASDELRSELKNAGIGNVVEYEKGNDAERMKKANEVPDIRFSIDEELTENLQRVLNGDFDAKNNEVHIGTTSNFLTDVIGANGLDLYMPAEKAYRAMATEEHAVFDGKPTGKNINYHGLDVDGLVKILNASEQPIAAFAAAADESGKRENRIVLVTDVEAKGGLGVVIEEMDTTARSAGDKIKANKAITVYPKGNVSSAIQEAIADHRILYLDEKRSQAHLAVRKGSNYPTVARKADFTDNIRSFWENVKWKNTGKAEYTSESAKKTTPEWKKRLAELSEKRSVDDAEGLRVRASRMSVNTLRERLSRVEGMIRGYEMTENLSETKQKELDKLKENRDIFKEELEEKKKKAKALRAKTRQEVSDDIEAKRKTKPNEVVYYTKRKFSNEIIKEFSVPIKDDDAWKTVDAYLNKFTQTGKVEDDDVTKLWEYLMEHGETSADASPQARELRAAIAKSRIYVPPEVVAEFGDEWNDYQRRAFGANVYLSKQNEELGGIAEHYKLLSDAFGEEIFPPTDDLRQMLEQMVTVAVDGKKEHMSLYEYLKRVKEGTLQDDENVTELYDGLKEKIKEFAETAEVEIRLRKKTAYELARDRAERRAKAEEIRERKQLAELQKNTLKQLQDVSRNLRTAPQGKLRAEMEEILNGINIITVKTANEMNYSGKYEATWKDLARMYAEAKANDPNWIPNRELDKIMSRVNDISLEEMTPDELRALYESAVALNTSYHHRNDMKGDELHRTYEKVAASTVKEISAAKKPKNRFGKKAQHIRETLNPIHYLEYLAGWNPDSVFYNKLAKDLENGERKMRRYQEEANQMLDSFLTENKAWIEKADGRGKDGIWYEYDVPELVELKLGQKPVFGDTKKIYMTPMQKVMLALESRNYDNLMHMLGGRIFPDKAMYQKGDTEEAFSSGTNVKLAPETVKNLVKDLTAEEQALYDILAKYYNDYSKKQINETSNALYGYDKAMSSFYAPITTSRNYTKSTPGKFDMTAEGVGHMKGRIYGAKNPTLNLSALEAFRRHVAQTSEFVGLAIPIENLNRTLNWYTGDQTVKGIIAEQWSAKDEKYINNLMEEIQGAKHIPDGAIDKAVNAIESGYIGATFAFNPSVAMKVFGSWFTAMGSLNPKYAMNSFKKVDEDLVRKYTSELDIRKRGYSTPELAKIQMEQGKINKLIQSNKVTKDVFGGGWMIAADVSVAKGLWSWAEAQVTAETNLRPGTQEQVNSGTDEFYREVARKFEEAIGNTQSMYDTMHRSQVMKQDGIARAFTMFHTDTLQCLNILTKNIGEARYLKNAAAADPKNDVLRQRADKAQENVSSAINGVVLCSLEVALVSVLNSLLKRRDKFEDEEGNFDWGEAGAEFTTSFLQGFTGMLPGWDVAMNAMVEFALGGKTYDVQLPGLSMMNDLLQGGISLAEKIKSGKDLTMEDVKDISLQIAKAAGLPFENIEKYVTGILAWVSPSLAQAYDDMFAAPKKSDLNELSGAAQERAVYDMVKEYGASKQDAKEIARLYSEGYTKAVAGDVPDSITVDGEKIQLTKEDKEKYKTVMGETLSKISEVLNSEEYRAADDQEKENMLRRVNEFAHATAKKAVNSEYEMPSWTQSAQDLIDMGKGIMSVAAMPYSSKKASSSSESEDNRFTQLVKGGIEYNNAADIERTLQDITPSNGKSVRDVDKLVAVAEMPIGEDEKDIAFAIILGSKTYEEYKTAIKAGALSYQYADFRKELERINDNSSVSQEEFETAANASNLPTEAAKQMWYARGWKKQSPWG